VTAWGKLAETLDSMTQNGYVTKGRQVFVEGRFEPREYQDQNGQTKMSLDVTANEFQLLGARSEGDGSQGGGGSRGPSGGPRGGEPDEVPGNFDDVPF
jgi:single-strand DNA-binding protein